MAVVLFYYFIFLALFASLALHRIAWAYSLLSRGVYIMKFIQGKEILMQRDN